VLLVAALGASACASPSDAGSDASSATTQTAPALEMRVIQHGTPKRDFKDDITTPQVAMPKELYLDYGTYFWSVSALQNDRGSRQVRDGGLRHRRV